MKIKQITILTLLAIALQIYCANPRRYITHEGSGLKDGTSWENAGGAKELEDIIDSIQDADFWIAKGIYKPSRYVSDPEDERDMTFLPNHNFIYGGFAGNETDLSQRNIKENETIFSGDIGIEADMTDNCYHVMRAVQILDGVTICDGNANGSSDPNYYGGGVYVWSSPSIFRNCKFRDNYASQQGGAVFMDTWGYDVIFENCLFYNNETKYGGGGAIFSYYSYTTITNCTFVKNTVEVSGIISIPYYFEGNSKITNNIFWNNKGNNIGYDNYKYSGYVLNNAIEGGYDGFENINLSAENTGFKNSPYFTDPDNNDYSLKSISPCIDAGVYWNTSCGTDIAGNPRPQGKSWDIGAYEYNSGAFTSVPPSVVTLPPEFTTVSSARVKGNVTDDGGSKMISKGVYYSTIPAFDPTTQGILVKYNHLYSEGEFHIDITNLLPNTMYYYRIFCENRAGAVLGEEWFFTTRSGINPDANGILYVKPDGTGDGSSWVNALHGNDLQLAVNNESVKDIWLTKGKYVPTGWPSTVSATKEGRTFSTDDFVYKLQEDSLKAKGVTEYKLNGTSDREKHFMLQPGKAIYGGFIGTETSLEQRDFRANKTILSGDIGAEAEYFDNTYHVIYHYYNPEIDSTALLDGVTVSDGYANGSIWGDSGMGGGMFNYYSSPNIRNCTFENNRAIWGGGMINGCSPDEGRSKPNIINTQISNNTAYNSGGGIHNSGAAPYLENSEITNNIAVIAGGGIYHYAEDYVQFATYSNTVILHSTIAGNESPQGSQIVFSTDSWNTITVLNSIVWGLEKNIVWLYTDSQPATPPQFTTIKFCASADNFQSIGEGNVVLSSSNLGFSNSPYFNDPANNIYSLQYNSACKDMAFYIYSLKYDIIGSIRPQGAAYDLGAYEFITDEPNAVSPSLVTLSADNITATTALCHTEIANTGGSPIIRRGIKISPIENFNPETSGTLFSINEEYFESQYAILASLLSHNTDYFYRSFAENRMGNSYGQQEYFKTNYMKPDINGIFYISENGSGEGSSWANALNGKDLQAAINHSSTKQIWIADGIYKPNSWPTGGSAQREMHFTLRKNIAVYGGFAGNEDDISERDILLNKTVFSGDIGLENETIDNCYTVIMNENIDSTTVFDGITVTLGNNDLEQGEFGAGMYNFDSSPTIRNCSFLCNIGGGVNNNNFGDFSMNDKLNMIIDNCRFIENIGGGLRNQSSSRLLLTNSVFINNYASEFGGGIYTGGRSYIINCLFVGNKTDLAGGAICLDINTNNKSCYIINSTLVENESEYGSGLQMLYTTNNTSVINCTFFNNGNDIDKWYYADIPLITNCAMTQSTMDFTHTAENNILISTNNSGDPNSPYFSDPENGHWWLQEASPLKDAGIWTGNVPLFDIMGFSRDDKPDIGCYEFDPTSIEDDGSALPHTAELYQNYPNPFNPTTSIRFALSRPGHVELAVYNVLGQFVKKLADKDFVAGYHSVLFEADYLNSGVYYYRLKAEGKELTKKMLMVK
jgi:hypothetical protein